MIPELPTVLIFFVSEPLLADCQTKKAMNYPPMRSTLQGRITVCFESYPPFVLPQGWQGETLSVLESSDSLSPAQTRDLFVVRPLFGSTRIIDCAALQAASAAATPRCYRCQHDRQ